MGNFKMPGAPYMGKRDVEMGVAKGGAPKMSKMYEKSGMKTADGKEITGEGAPFLKNLFSKGRELAKKAFKNPLINPIGAIASRFKKPNTNVDTNANNDTVASNEQPPVDPNAPVVDPTQPPVDPNMQTV